jgi:hypothetical protein
VKLSLMALRGYLNLVNVAVLCHVLNLAGTFVAQAHSAKSAGALKSL